MSETKVQRRTWSIEKEHGSENPSDWLIVDDTGRYIAYFPRLIDSAVALQREHARLIAAAPELFHALKDCIEILMKANFNEEIPSVAAAIAKATGSAA